MTKKNAPSPVIAPPKPNATQPVVATATQPTSDEKYRTFLHWYSIPPEQKIRSHLPVTIPDFLTAHSLTNEDLSFFYNKETFADDVVEATVKWAKTKTSEMVHILYDRYKERKNASDFSAFVDFITKINAKDKASNQQINIFNLNDEQYRQIIARESRILQGDTIILDTGSKE